MATVDFDRSSGLRVDGLGGDVRLKTVNVVRVDGLRIHSNKVLSTVFYIRSTLYELSVLRTKLRSHANSDHGLPIPCRGGLRAMTLPSPCRTTLDVREDLED